MYFSGLNIQIQVISTIESLDLIRSGLEIVSRLHETPQDVGP